MRWTLVISALCAALLFLYGAQPDPRTIPDHPLPPITPTADGLYIVALGTSLTHRSRWIQDLPRQLELCGVPHTTIRRIARPGANSLWGLGQIRTVAEMKPDIVIVEFSINDSDIIDGLWPWQSHETIKTIITEITALTPSSQVLLVSTPPVSGFMQKLKRPFLAVYQAQYATLAASLGVGYLNGTARWTSNDLDAAFTDGLHPEPHIESRLMVPALARMIARSLGLSCDG